MKPTIHPFFFEKDISKDVLSWNLHGTEHMSRPRSEAPAGALTWDPFRATPGLRITHNPPFNVDKVKAEATKNAEINSPGRAENSTLSGGGKMKIRLHFAY